jgi:hypothetical protein
LRKKSSLWLAALLGAASACSDHISTAANASLQHGVWGSTAASLTVADSGATLEILNGSCYGSYGQIAQPIASGHFDLAGTYTQLIGAYPGKLQYPAQYSGAVSGNALSVTISVPALQATFGPFDLAYGVSNSWTQCLYP